MKVHVPGTLQVRDDIQQCRPSQSPFLSLADQIQYGATRNP